MKKISYSIIILVIIGKLTFSNNPELTEKDLNELTQTNEAYISLKNDKIKFQNIVNNLKSLKYKTIAKYQDIEINNLNKCVERIKKNSNIVPANQAINALNEAWKLIQNTKSKNKSSKKTIDDLKSNLIAFSQEIENNNLLITRITLEDISEQSVIDENKTRVPPTITSGSSLGDLSLSGFDGTNYTIGSKIEAIAENTITSGSVPSNLRISVTPDGGSLTEKARVFSTGSIGIDGGLHVGGITDVGDNNLTVDGTTTLSSLSTGVVKSNGSGVLSSSTIVDADVNASAAISDTKLATISTSGKVANSATTATNANTASAIVARDGSGNFNTNMITLAGTTTNSTDAATKSYVDSVAQGLNIKSSVKAIATTNQTISGVPGGTIDGVTMIADDRILLTGQTTASENGIWIIKSGSWVRPSDFAAGSSAASSFVFVEQGTSYADSGWVCTTDSPNDIVDTNNLSFTQFSGAGQINGVNVGAGEGQVFKDKSVNNLNFKTLLAGSFMTITNNTNDITFDANGQTTNVVNSLVSRDGSGDFAAGTATLKNATIEETTPANTTVRIGSPTVLGANEGMVSIAGKTNIGITDNADAGNLLNVGGRINATGFDTISDSRVKTNKKNINPKESLEIIKSLQPKIFKFKKSAIKKHNLESGIQRGLIAQEVEKVLPNLVRFDGNKNNLHKLDYAGIIPDMIGAIKSCANLIDSYKTELKKLKARIDLLEAKN